MTQVMLIIYPSKEAFVGLYWPASNTWKTLSLTPTHAPHNRYLTAITNLLAQHHTHLRDITHIGVYAGPATYTELRSGVTTANTLAWALTIPLFTVTNETQLPIDLPTAALGAEINRPIAPIYPTEIS